MLIRLTLASSSYEQLLIEHRADPIGIEFEELESVTFTRHWVTLADGVGGIGYYGFSLGGSFKVYVRGVDGPPIDEGDQASLELIGLHAEAPRPIGFGWWQVVVLPTRDSAFQQRLRESSK